LRELEGYDLLNTSKRSARLFAELRFWLQNKGIQMTPFDLLIAAIVIDNDGVLVTCDKQFKRVPDLKVLIVDT